MPSDGRGLVSGSSYYVDATGNELLGFHALTTRSDQSDFTFLRRSPDNGRNWLAAEQLPTLRATPAGTWRRQGFVCCAHPSSGRFVALWTEGVLPTDDAMEGGLRWYQVCYGVFEDGGRTSLHSGPVVCAGDEFNATHPLPGVIVGRNSFLIGDLPCSPLVLGDGTIVQPVQITPVDESGELFNPANGLKYRDSAVLLGTMQTDGSIRWEVSERIIGDPDRTTRGVLEPTIAALDGGRLMLVMRGSNDTWPPRGAGDEDAYVPARKWFSLSSDGGRSWSSPQPWTDTGGTSFYSPSSCSQLVPHSSGRLFWFGNVLPHNAVGNRPRYPMVMGEVDTRSGLIKAGSFTIIDTLGPNDSPSLQLSCFHAREDRETGDLLLHMPRMFAASPPDRLDWNSDLYQYRIQIS